MILFVVGIIIRYSFSSYQQLYPCVRNSNMPVTVTLLFFPPFFVQILLNSLPPYAVSCPLVYLRRGRRRHRIDVRVRNSIHGNSGRHRLLNRSWKNRFGCPWTHILGAPLCTIYNVIHKHAAAVLFFYKFFPPFRLLISLSLSLYIYLYRLYFVLHWRPRALFWTNSTAWKGKLGIWKGKWAQRRRYTTAAATSRFVYGAVWFISKYKEYQFFKPVKVFSLPSRAATVHTSGGRLK